MASSDAPSMPMSVPDARPVVGEQCRLGGVGGLEEAPTSMRSPAPERNVAIQTIRSTARRPWPGRPHTRVIWYEPLQEQNDIDLAVWWVLSRPGGVP
jgi:hypothetical protein